MLNAITVAWEALFSRDATDAIKCGNTAIRLRDLALSLVHPPNCVHACNVSPCTLVLT